MLAPRAPQPAGNPANSQSLTSKRVWRRSAAGDATGSSSHPTLTSGEFRDFLLLSKTSTGGAFWKVCLAPSHQTTPTFSSGHIIRLRHRYLKCSRPSAAHLDRLRCSLQHHWSTCELILLRLLGVRHTVVSLSHSHCLCVLTSCR